MVSLHFGTLKLMVNNVTCIHMAKREKVGVLYYCLCILYVNTSYRYQSRPLDYCYSKTNEPILMKFVQVRKEGI